MNKTTLSPTETKTLLKHIVTNNKYLQENNEIPIALNIEGRAGIGKTSIVSQVANELNIPQKNVVILSLTQFEELGELIGMPIKQYFVYKKTDDKELKKWIYEEELSKYITSGFVIKETRMSYAKPEWIVGKKENGILYLDDFSRSSSRFMQAVMELINKQEYSTWKLPAGWTIVLSSNPENNDYTVTDLDPAQKSRFLTVNMEIAHEDWIDWAYKNNLDERCIAFVSLNPECLKPIANKDEVNPRSLHNFFKSISSIKDYKKDLLLIQTLGEAAIGAEITTMFTMFINNNLYMLPSAVELFETKDSNKTIDILHKAIMQPSYRADIAAVMSQRIVNYLLNIPKPNNEIINIVKGILTSDVLGNDAKFALGQKLINDEQKRYNTIVADINIVNVILE